MTEQIKYCTYKGNYCNARIRYGKYSLCCRYGLCGYAEQSHDRIWKHKPISKTREANND